MKQAVTFITHLLKCHLLPLWCNAHRVGVNLSNTLHRVFAPCLCHRGQTHMFRHCSSAAAGALEYPKKKSRNGDTDVGLLKNKTKNNPPQKPQKTKNKKQTKKPTPFKCG